MLQEPAPDAGSSDDDISGAAFILAKYILDTGDIDGVMEFLQGMVRAGKVSSEVLIIFHSEAILSSVKL